METKLFDKNCITLDGRMDEPAWDSVRTYTDFRTFASKGSELVAEQTFFKIIPCEDRIYIGVKCMEPDIADAIVHKDHLNGYGNAAIELFFSPSGTPFDFYQFFIDFNGTTLISNYYEENGNVQPDRYAPEWKTAIYYGEDYWSLEAEFPLSAFYMTAQNRWNDTWLVNVGRTRRYTEPGRSIVGLTYSTWSPVYIGFLDSKNYRPIEGFPMRRECDDVCISSAMVDLNEKTENGYRGTMKVQVNCTVGDEYELSSDHADVTAVTLTSGRNVINAPCYFDGLGRFRVELAFKRMRDGAIFKRYYPVVATYEPIKLRLTLPEYRGNFYPGQDYSKVAGTVITSKAVTLKLEGPGIETQEITPSEDGSFAFETPNFELGEAWLTATTATDELKKKIRRLAPTGHMMTWISGGNLIVNGKPLLRRNMFSPYYGTGTAFNKRLETDLMHETREITGRYRQPSYMINTAEKPGGEATKDQMPSAEMLAKYDAFIEEVKDTDFAFIYLSDEPECRGLSNIYFKHLYEYVADKDPYHVILSASRDPDQYVDMADWFENHAYINPFMDESGKRTYARQMNVLGSYIDKISKLNRPDKCIGYMPTTFCNEGSVSDYPTFEELVCHPWAAMIHGGKTLCPYAHHDLNDRPTLVEGTRYMFSSFEALEDIVLMGKRTTLMRTDASETVLYEYENEKMFVLVNFLGEEQTVTVDGLSGEWYNFRHEGKITGNIFNLKPFEVVIGTTEIRDAGLPTYDETAALVEKLEYERTHRGNLLFNRQGDLEFTHSAPHHFGFRKLFDGVQDNLAWICNFGQKFLEINLTKVNPTFSKVVVHGFNIEDMTVQVRNDGELSVPAIAQTRIEGYAHIFELAESITPECLRFEFPKDRVEVYEIEVFA